jgi:superfamily II DNA/RNA helicase
MTVATKSIVSSPPRYPITSTTIRSSTVLNHHQRRQGEIRSLLLAPSRELAAQLHREGDRLGRGTPNHHGNIASILLVWWVERMDWMYW